MKMRKLAIISTLLLVLIQSLIGIHRYAHYCGDELSAQSLFVADQGTCECPEDEEEGCCTNEVNVYQQYLEFIDNPSEGLINTLDSFVTLMHFNETDNLFSVLNSQITSTLLAHPKKPDRSPEDPLYLRFSVFRI